MILNDHQYKVSKKAAAKLRSALTRSRHSTPPDVDTRLARAETAAMRSQLEDVEHELAEYESRPDAFRDFDPKKIFKDLPMSGFDMEKLSQMHARNVEALQAANQLATDGFETVARRQAEIMKGAMEQFSSAMRDMLSANGAHNSGSKQADIAKQMMEKAVGNVRELTELATKAQSEAFDVLTRRWMASLEEARDVFAKRKPPSDEEINDLIGRKA